MTRDEVGVCPSLHATFDATEQLLFLAVYACTYGRPDRSDVIPNPPFAETDLNQQDQNKAGGVRGTLILRNIALRPWAAENFDLAADY